MADGGSGDDTITGGEKGDYITGADGNDTFEGRGGIDFFNAGEGSDTVIYRVNYSPSEVFVSNDETRVQSELVSSADWVQFVDRTITANQANYSTQDAINYSSLNGYRVSNSKILLSKPSDLADFAMDWSLEMASQNQLTNSSQSDRAPLFIGDRTVIAENVATVVDSGQSNIEIANYFHNYWINNGVASSNMLNNNFLEVGVGIVKSNGSWWATQIFMG